MHRLTIREISPQPPTHHRKLVTIHQVAALVGVCCQAVATSEKAIAHGESKLIFGWLDVIVDVSQMRGHISSPSVMRFSHHISSPGTFMI